MSDSNDFNFEKTLSDAWKTSQNDDIEEGTIERSWKQFNIKYRLNKNTRWSTKVRVNYAVASVLIVLLVVTVFTKLYVFEPNLIETRNTSNTPLYLHLVDGSKITLSPGSSLNYPETFSDSQRKVQLKGKAFFEIKRDVSKPFIVDAGLTQTKVLGTSFHIHTDSITLKSRISLFTGKVEVSVKDRSYKINPGEELRWNPTNSVAQIIEFNKEVVDAWRKEQLVFNNESLKNVFKTLASKFNTSIHLNNPNHLENLHLTLTVGSNNSLLEILEIIQKVTHDISITIKENNEIIIN